MMYFLISLGLSLVATILIKKLAKKINLVDRPDTERRFHSAPVPLLGGVAIWLAFWAVTAYLLFFNPLYDLSILFNKLVWVFVGSLVLMILGVIDDRSRVSAKTRLILTAIAVLVSLLGGLGSGLDKITNPFGGVISLSGWSFQFFNLGTIFWLADLLVFGWLMGMMYTTKITDGLDGLATGVVFIGSLVIYFLSSSTKFFQPNVALLALVFAGACLGFLILNFHPAKIFLGEGGSLFVGYMLGVLAVISGGKVATALLVMAIPILDLARVIYLRLHLGQPIFKGDRKHLYYQLLDRGWSVRQVVLSFYGVAAAFGFITLFLQSIYKIIALVCLFFAMMVMSYKISKS